jgi:hypothetical protein
MDFVFVSFNMWVHLHGVFWASMKGIGQQVGLASNSSSRLSEYVWRSS